MSSASRIYFWCVHVSVSTASVLVQSHQAAPRLFSLHPLLPLSYPFSTPKPGFLLKIKILFLYSHVLSPPRASHCTEDKLQKPLVCPTKPQSLPTFSCPDLPPLLRRAPAMLVSLYSWNTSGSDCLGGLTLLFSLSERPPPHSPQALSQMLFSQRGLR